MRIWAYPGTRIMLPWQRCGLSPLWATRLYAGCFGVEAEADNVADSGVGQVETVGEPVIDVHDRTGAKHTVERGNDKTVAALLRCHSGQFFRCKISGFPVRSLLILSSRSCRHRRGTVSASSQGGGIDKR